MPVREQVPRYFSFVASTVHDARTDVVIVRIPYDARQLVSGKLPMGMCCIEARNLRSIVLVELTGRARAEVDGDKFSRLSAVHPFNFIRQGLCHQNAYMSRCT